MRALVPGMRACMRTTDIPGLKQDNRKVKARFGKMTPFCTFIEGMRAGFKR